MADPSSKNAALGYTLVATAAASWGLWPLMLRRAEAHRPLDPKVEAVVFMAVMAVVAAAFVPRDQLAVPKRIGGWLGIVWLGFSNAMNVVTFFAAYQKTTVAIAVMTHYLTPIFVALAAPWFLRERADRRTAMAVGASFVGLVLLLGPWRDGGAHDLLGATFGATSAVFYASYVLFSKRLASRFSGSELTCFHGTVAVAVLVFLAPEGAWSSLSWPAMRWLLLGSIGPGALGALFFMWGLRRIKASHASTLTLLEPLCAVLVGALAFGEVPPWISLVGAGLILSGGALVIATRDGR